MSARRPSPVRQWIGVVPQRPNPDRGLTVIENLTFHAAYFGFSRSASARRAQERSISSASATGATPRWTSSRVASSNG